MFTILLLSSPASSDSNYFKGISKQIYIFKNHTAWFWRSDTKMKDWAESGLAAVLGNSVESILNLLGHPCYSGLLTEGAPTEFAGGAVHHDAPTVLVAVGSALHRVGAWPVNNWSIYIAGQLISLWVLTFLEGNRTLFMFRERFVPNGPRRVISLRQILLLVM